MATAVKRNMIQWLEDMKRAPRKKALPVLSFPTIQLMGITVEELISDSDRQAQGMKLVADRVDSAAAVSMMDLSVEAEAFGSTIRVSPDEVPTVVGSIVPDLEAAEALQVPAVGAGRTGLYIEAMHKACQLITDRPVLAGVIGPFSLAGRLMDVTETMVNCYTEPEMVHEVMKKATQFLIEYVKGYKEAGTNGVVMAEPLTGLLSPDLAAEFSEPYVRQIIEAVQDENFIVIYHNCGNNTIQMIDSILAVNAAAYHFGNAISMAEMLTKVPADTIVMGNVDPAGEFRNGTPESIKAATKEIMAQCCSHPNFVISSGCDIPPLSPWENIDAFFEAVDEFYAQA
ncbi:MAG TPA: uroporphyrinogen decarboxylase family protein [Candidatus Gallacutalibacter stercoravium]|nr:uroporphyrinogen decarboxylase family protein [Candidatus Gallacutalibacter stercoravium]